MSELHTPGVSIAFIENGKVKWTRAYGVATVGGPPVTPNTLFQAGSMSKPVAATAALRLVELGRLDLDGDINSHLTAWKVPPSQFTATQKVTLRQLLGHRGGMTVGGFEGYSASKAIPTSAQILDGSPPSNSPAVKSFEPPGAYAYSGGGYVVAQLAVEESLGQTFPQALQQLVLGPAGMRHSTFVQPLPENLLGGAASGHDAQGVPIPGGRNTYPEYAAAGLWTTPSDYGRFMIALQNSFAGRPHAILSQPSAKMMMTSSDAGYGLGVSLGKRGGHPYFQHGGSNVGFQSGSVAFLDRSRQGLIVMVNGDGGGALAAEILRAVSEAYQWGDYDPQNGASSRRAPSIP
jgi:CubicO group peptidase (beta-lactamase class C family)